VAAGLGYKDLKSFSAAVAADPKFHGHSRKEIVDLYSKYIDQMYPKLPELFGHMPKVKLEVMPMEEFREKGGSAAEYNDPASDGSRPGRVMVNTGDFEKRSLLDIETTAYHEGVPGHHMQIATAQEMPELLGAKVAGFCRPALGVGGDYYDVIDLGEKRVGLAVGDVSGKGISAALLMASLRASLRGITLDSPRDFAKLMHKVNQLVYEASASNRYATFFFASYDPATRTLECVNAGHNPPVILRGQETIRLEADGPVVGLLPFAPYTEQMMTLEPGDLLILYTDGISEAMTKDDEEWGEESMIAAARASMHKTASEVLDDLFVAADAFTAGAPQHDDMTLLLLKLES